MSYCKHSRMLNAFHDAELPEDQCRDLEKHIRQCPSCAQELERIRSLSALLAKALTAEMPAEALRRLHQSLGSIRERVMLRVAEVFSLAAAIVLVVCSAWLWHAGKVQEFDADSVAAWETTAVTLKVEDTSPAYAEEQFAGWILDSLSEGKEHD